MPDLVADTRIRRRFADVSHGQVHYREAGQGEPVLFLHASPGSSKQLAGMITDFAEKYHVIAPDTPGNGDSDPLPNDLPEIPDLAAAILEFMDAVGLERVGVYGSHTGACIAAELSILAPGRITGIIPDGVLTLTDEKLQDYLASYAHPFEADHDGSYLLKTFMFCRDQYVFFPWYERSAEAQRKGGLGTARDLKDWVVEVLKASETYHLNYRAAFRWQAAERLSRVKSPVLLAASESDPILGSTQSVAEAVDGTSFTTLPRFDDPTFRTQRLETLGQFLDACARRSLEQD
jgi:pimeloyl-ACP methyl ester carboxylesterase